MGPAGVLGAGLIRVLGSTWRVEWRGGDAAGPRGADGHRCIFAFWHARMLALAFTHRDRNAAVLVSRSRDGEIITRVIEHLGFVAARGSSTRGGEEGALDMLQRAGEERMIAITPDGPRGPAERVKPGLAWLAGRSGRAVVPVAAAASRSWVLRSWDGFRIPKPFAHVCVAYGAPASVPAGLEAADAETWRRRREDARQAITREARERVGERP